LELDYPILSDPKGDTARMFGVIDDNRSFPQRWTFFISKDGELLAVEKKVDFRSHGKQIAEKLADLKVDKAK